MSDFAKAIGYQFDQPDLCAQALEHRGKENERMEFLGDRVLGLVVSEYLHNQYAAESVGALARRHAALVSGEVCAQVTLSWGMAARFRGHNGKVSERALADACEAVIGAVFLDGGFAVARDFILRHWQAHFAAQIKPPRDPKSTLQEWAMAAGHALPHYQIIDQIGDDHAPEFEVEVAVEKLGTARGRAGTRRLAEKQAARAFLKQYGVERE